MIPSFSSRTLSRGAAFTLIELLVVIAIISILAGLLLPVVNKVTENARKVSAKASETQIVAAINNYQTEYGQYPVDTSAAGTTPKDKTFGMDNHNSDLFNVLRALNANAGTAAYQLLNSRRIVYFEGKNVKNSSVPRDGFIQSLGGKTAYSKTPLAVGDLVDPWGNVYMARIDTGYSNAVENPYKSAPDGADDVADAVTITDPADLHVGAIAYSYGADGVAAGKGVANPSPYTTIGDDVISWQ